MPKCWYLFWLLIPIITALYGPYEVILISNDYRKVSALLHKLRENASIDARIMNDIAIIPKLESLAAILDHRHSHPAFNWQKDRCLMYRNSHMSAMKVFENAHGFREANCATYYIIEMIDRKVSAEYIIKLLFDYVSRDLLSVPNSALEEKFYLATVSEELKQKYFELAYG